MIPQNPRLSSMSVSSHLVSNTNSTASCHWPSGGIGVQCLAPGHFNTVDRRIGNRTTNPASHSHLYCMNVSCATDPPPTFTFQLATERTHYCLHGIWTLTLSSNLGGVERSNIDIICGDTGLNSLLWHSNNQKGDQDSGSVGTALTEVRW